MYKNEVRPSSIRKDESLELTDNCGYFSRLGIEKGKLEGPLACC